ncbi:hypothetical protein HU200_048820 [Digitaria exilis]|uniref:Uncharacterized protein n=1 Tax=Digitaria exilis TaxID=1010633 RepID=A0A835AUT8_9POAL|nr:hypothetical protein HU200_048820 [Digitaria exilis]
MEISTGSSVNIKSIIDRYVRINHRGQGAEEEEDASNQTSGQAASQSKCQSSSTSDVPTRKDGERTCRRTCFPLEVEEERREKEADPRQRSVDSSAVDDKRKKIEETISFLGSWRRKTSEMLQAARRGHVTGGFELRFLEFIEGELSFIIRPKFFPKLQPDRPKAGPSIDLLVGPTCRHISPPPDGYARGRAFPRRRRARTSSLSPPALAGDLGPPPLPSSLSPTRIGWPPLPVRPRPPCPMPPRRRGRFSPPSRTCLPPLASAVSPAASSSPGPSPAALRLVLAVWH